MELRKLESFIAVANTLNYTEAANQLFTTQATISKHILSLEEELGVVLIDRTHRHVKLTAAGRASLPYARQMIEAQHQLKTALASQQLQAGMTLLVRGIPTISSYQAFNIVTTFSNQHSDIDLNFAEAEANTLVPALKNGHADIVFLRLFDSQPIQGLTVLVESSDRFVVVMPKTHSLAKRKSLQIAALADQTLLQLNESTNLSAPVFDLFKEAGIAPRIRYSGQRIDLILEMIERGMGLSVMMGHSFDLHAYPELTTVPLTPVRYSHLAFAKLQNHHTPAADLFWAYATQALAAVNHSNSASID
ncbi:LysR family transcriptional regulator [Lacticaseibacillus mingshuiensis]|uniref:LysR family transcriptional regulator n=2 Tax=Lacticaseibacillus mingshuiensis TaxID=2799574 RepID=A0ABW4CFK5_9LACO|nr:LysR family transcriptional regulator [Lacticaseibacillus mingshuiensis]